MANHSIMLSVIGLLTIIIKDFHRKIPHHLLSIYLLVILKLILNLSDENVVEPWSENA
jgi:hypothetical protein